jgi:hypothetical protein
MAPWSSIALVERIGPACSRRFCSGSWASLERQSEADYARSDVRLRHDERAPRNDGGTPRNVINGVIDETEARHGSTAAYLLQAGASVEDLERIRRRFAGSETP